MNVFQRCAYSLMRTTRLGGLVEGAFKERYIEISLLSQKQNSLGCYEKENIRTIIIF